MQLVLLLVGWFHAVGAPVTTELQVLREDGSPVADATVSMVGLPGTARTDSRGRLRWSPALTPPFEVLVVLASGQYMAPFLVEAVPETGPVVIRVAPLLTESVTVTAGVAPHIEATPANATNVVRREDIALRRPNRLTDVLENVPGVATISEGHAAVPAIRGLARGRTLILVDGARVTTERRAGPSASYLDPFFLEGVEVSRGPGSVGYGSDAFGGVIHARTRVPEPGSPLRFRVTTSLGAGVDQKGVGAEIARGLKEGGLLFQARFRDFDDFTSPAGDVFNSSARDQGFLVRWQQEIGGGRLNLGWQTDQARDVGRPRDNSRAVRTLYPEENSHRLTGSYEPDPFWGFTRVALSGFVGGYRLLTDQERASGALTTIERADVSAKDWSLRALAVRPYWRGRLEAGVDLNGRWDLEAADQALVLDEAMRVITSQSRETIESGRRTDSSLYASTEVQVTQPLSLSGGMRLDLVGTRNRGGFFGDRSTSHQAWSGYGSFRWTVWSGTALTGQVSRGFRDPSLSDRYFRGVTGRGFITGNPDLGPETSLQFDLALRHTGHRVRWAVFAYQYKIRDLIERFETDRDFFFFRNRGEARLRGVEVELQADLGAGLGVEVGAHLSRGDSPDDGSYLDDVPVETITLQFRKGFARRGNGYLRVALFSRDDRPGPTERVTPGHGTLDAGATWRFTERVELRVVARNLLDKDYLLSPDPRAVLAPGVSGLATLALTF
jgi:iron complex outermembrane receptor protein